MYVQVERESAGNLRLLGERMRWVTLGGSGNMLSHILFLFLFVVVVERIGHGEIPEHTISTHTHTRICAHTEIRFTVGPFRSKNKLKKKKTPNILSN